MINKNLEGFDITNMMLLFSNIGNSSSFIPFLIILGQLASFLFKRRYEIKYILSSYNVEYVLESHIVPIVNFNVRTEKTTYKLKFSKKFQAIQYYINQNIDTIPFRSLSEVLETNSEISDKYKNINQLIDDKKYRENTDDNYIYLPLEDKQILISKKYNIYLRMFVLNNEEKNNMEYYKLYLSIPLYSYLTYLYYLIFNLHNFNNFYNKLKDNKLVIIKQFIDECVNEYELYQKKLIKDKTLYIYQYRCLDDKLLYDKFKMLNNKDFLSNIFLENKEHFHNYFKTFINTEYEEKYDKSLIEYNNIQKQKYKKCGMTFKCGMLFYGSPGCGKTSTIKSILKYTNRHGILINLDKVKTARELQLLFNNTKYHENTYKPEELCFILEDCDATTDSFIRSRKLKNKDTNESSSNTTSTTNKNNDEDNNYNDGDKPNLTTFLNILDGIVELNDVMIIMTTNHPELLDDALIRPGRIDYKYEFKKASKQIICEMLAFKYDLHIETIKSHKLYNKLKDYQLSHAQIQSILFQDEYDYAYKKIALLCNGKNDIKII